MAVISMKNVINAVNDDTEIEIYKGDQLLAKGNWYHSQILKYGEEDVVEADWDCLNNKCKVKICGANEKTFYKFCVGKVCVNRTGPYMSYRASANNCLGVRFAEDWTDKDVIWYDTEKEALENRLHSNEFVLGFHTGCIPKFRDEGNEHE